jgi:hypothetical protein
MGTNHGSMHIHGFHRLTYERTVLVSITTLYYLFIMDIHIQEFALRFP